MSVTTTKLSERGLKSLKYMETAFARAAKSRLCTSACLFNDCTTHNVKLQEHIERMEEVEKGTEEDEE